jgi:hypothetical protein
MQSSAYELEDEPRLGHAAIKATNSDGSSSKVRSRWTSIRPHLSASHREADQAFDSKNYTRTSSSAGNLPSSSPLSRDVFGKLVALKVKNLIIDDTLLRLL